MKDASVLHFFQDSRPSMGSVCLSKTLFWSSTCLSFMRFFWKNSFFLSWWDASFELWWLVIRSPFFLVVGGRGDGSSVALDEFLFGNILGEGSVSEEDIHFWWCADVDCGRTARFLRVINQRCPYKGEY